MSLICERPRLLCLAIRPFFPFWPGGPIVHDSSEHSSLVDFEITRNAAWARRAPRGTSASPGGQRAKVASHPNHVIACRVIFSRLRQKNAELLNLPYLWRSYVSALNQPNKTKWKDCFPSEIRQPGQLETWTFGIECYGALHCIVGSLLAIQWEKQLNIIVSSRDMHIQRWLPYLHCRLLAARSFQSWMASKFYASIHGFWELGDFGDVTWIRWRSLVDALWF